MNDEDERNTIKLLNRLNEAEFPVIEMLKLTETPEIVKNIKSLCLKMGSRLIRTELDNEDNISAFVENKMRFGELLKTMQDTKTIFSLVHFAWDLLQFYTIVCEPKLQEQTTLVELNRFLTSKESLFSNCANNLFVLEYKIITVYNEVVLLLEGMEKGTVTAAKANEKSGILFPLLNAIMVVVDTRVLTVPDDAFAIYLSFAIKYTGSQFAEAQFKANEKSYTLKDKLNIADQQKAFLAAAQKDLNKIKIIQEFTSNMGHSFIPGEQYCFGRSMFRKLPTDSFEMISDHVTALASATI